MRGFCVWRTSPRGSESSGRPSVIPLLDSTSVVFKGLTITFTSYVGAWQRLDAAPCVSITTVNTKSSMSQS